MWSEHFGEYVTWKSRCSKYVSCKLHDWELGKQYSTCFVCAAAFSDRNSRFVLVFGQSTQTHKVNTSVLPHTYAWLSPDKKPN